MALIKILGAALLSCAAFIGVNANAQQVTPVSCTWGTISSYGPPDNSWRDIVRACKESNGTLVANQSFRGYNGTGVMQNCVITPATNITYTGTCESPSFFRNIPPPPPDSLCTTPGVRIQGGCANSYDSSMLTNPIYLSRCGSGCALEYRTIGWTSACPNSGNGRSPEYGIFCK